MKSTLAAIVFLLAGSIATAATDKHQLLGQWRWSEKDVSNDLTFRDDATFLGNVAEHGKITWTYAGTWSLDGETVSYKYTRSSLERIPVGTTDHDKFIKITNKYFVVESASGALRKFSRIQ